MSLEYEPASEPLHEEFPGEELFLRSTHFERFEIPEILWMDP